MRFIETQIELCILIGNMVDGKREDCSESELEAQETRFR